MLREPGEALGRPLPLLPPRPLALALAVHAEDDAREQGRADLGGYVDAAAQVLQPGRTDRGIGRRDVRGFAEHGARDDVDARSV